MLFHLLNVKFLYIRVFGTNWRRYLRATDDARISSAVYALKNLCGDLETNLVGIAFVDAGCGSAIKS